MTKAKTLMTLLLVVGGCSPPPIEPESVPCPHDFLKRDPFGVCVCRNEALVFNIDTEMCEEPGATAQCLMAGEDCSDDAQACCNGSTCVDFGDGVVECAGNCATGNDCLDCCCIPLQGTGAVCALGFCSGECEPAQQCSAIGSLCDLDEDCCEFSAGGAWCVNDPNWGLSCAASCEVDDDCQSGCCAPLVTGGNACSDPSLCGMPAPEPPMSLATGWGHRVDE